MKIAILGTGQVGHLIGSKLIENGYQVMMGGRNADNEKGLAFVKENGNQNAFYGTFEDASKFSDIVFNATNGKYALEALKLAKTTFSGKTIVDVSNPLDFTTKPPTLIPEFSNTSSLGESIQNLFPEAKVVKTLNTMGIGLGVNPNQLNNGDHTLLIAGNDQEAKLDAHSILKKFGWKTEAIFDLGDITASRGMESYLGLFGVRVMMAGQKVFNIKIIKS
jgi:predicted dinucleotide-binding enzyme